MINYFNFIEKLLYYKPDNNITNARPVTIAKTRSPKAPIPINI